MAAGLCIPGFQAGELLRPAPKLLNVMVFNLLLLAIDVQGGDING